MIKEGSTVKIHYELLVDGKPLDSSRGREPLCYVHGIGQIVAGLEEHLVGLSEGVVTRVLVPPEKAYGEVKQDAIQTLPFDAFEDSAGLEVGRIIKGKTLQGQSFSATVRSIEGDQVTLDLNHPLAGKTLEFRVEIVEVSDAEGTL